MQRFESSFLAADRTQIFYQIWKQDRPRGVIFLVHGLGEHSECYADFVQDNASLNCDFVALDLRGHGRSQGPRGVVQHFSQLTMDVEMLIAEVKTSLPWMIFGHSMGGLVVMKTLLANKDLKPAGVLLSAPYLGLNMKVPAWKTKGAHILSVLAPSVTLNDEITDEMLSRDPEMLKKYQKDHLRHHRINARLFLGAVESIRFVQDRAAQFQLPLLMQIAYRDPIVSSPAAQSFYERVGSPVKELKVYADRKHEIFNDLGREEVLQDWQKFVTARFN